MGSDKSSDMNSTQVDNKVEQLLQQQIELLPKEIKPNRDLWVGIDHAIENGQQAKDKNRLQRFAGVAAGVVIFGWLSWLTMNIGNTSIEPVIDNGDGASEVIISRQNDQSLDFIEAMSQSYNEQKQALLVQYDGKESMVVDWHKQLDELDSAADAIKKALESDPSNAQLIKMLQQTYQQQLDLIKMVNRSPWQQI